ncbi:sugar transferase [Actinocrinis puniceicyclus]|uniref:Sugar transferase n=1 Tax=Actinocrinis puniceicyclus TaxID=977794 RepID=A0A8J8BEZ3_9ACTN|nr:sugar transferase [Actinocrinis puniceicyclus]MBS2966100.1 sugar transferase [Actinocrinis puniceicyclus]
MTVLNILTPERRARYDVRSGRHEQVRAYIRALVVADAVAALAGALAAYAWHPDGSDSANLQIFPLRLAVALMPPFWALALWLHRAYDRRRVSMDPELYRKVLGASGLLAAGAATGALLIDSMALFRLVIVSIPLAAALTPIARSLARAGLSRAGHSAERRRVLLVGHARSVEEFAAQVRPNRAPWLKIVGACLVGPTEPHEADNLAISVQGDLGSVVESATAMDCDAVVVLNCPELDGSALRDLSWRLHEQNIDLAIVPVLVGVAVERILVDTVDGLPMMHIRAPILSGPVRMVKEGFERAVAALALALLSPVLLVLAALVRLTSPGPALFRQVRVGLNGTEFECLKFRTMVADAERLREQLEHLNEKNDGVLFKIRRDPRITRVGRVLRKCSLDELPQLVNVLRGEMSLVGPRPPLPEEAARYSEQVRRRLAVKPGLTGLWQVSGRSMLSWDESVRLDLSYVENWSPQLDAKILLRTTSAVVRGTGAF